MQNDSDGFENEDEPRELTTDEVRERFLAYARDMVRVWSDPDLRQNPLDGRGDIERRVSGAVFSILVALDGAAGELPRFLVAPHPHPDDREYLRSEGENWFPENRAAAVKGNIAGMLHDFFYPPKSHPEPAGVDAGGHEGGTR